MQVALRKIDGSAGKNIEISPLTFGREFNEALVHQVVVAYMAQARAGTKAQKTRAQVSGGGAKPWAQKGTGRARAGTIRSPLWRKGGKVFAATPQDHSQKVNKKMYRGAMQAILSELVRQDRLIVVEELAINAPKTKALLEHMSGLNAGKSALILTDAWNVNLYLSARNVPGLEVREVQAADPVSLIKFEKVVITVSALKKLEEVFQ